MPEEYSRKELLEQFKKYVSDGKVSFEDLSSLVFDAKFPEDLFPEAKGVIVNAVDEHEKFVQEKAKLREMGKHIQEKILDAKGVLEEIIDLKNQRTQISIRIGDLQSKVAQIEAELEPLENEFAEQAKKYQE